MGAHRRLVIFVLAAAVAVVAVPAKIGKPATPPVQAAARITTTTSTVMSPSSTPPLTATTPPPAPLLPWTGPVEHIFFHTLVVDPALAFTHDRLGRGFRDYFVTTGEFRTILDQLYANGWTLVDIHRAVAGQVEVPAGRRPLVLSEDDVNYYDYERPHGLGWRLVVEAGGGLGVEVHHGDTVAVTDDDLVPMVDTFVADHPDFSADGAKGVIAVTGYEGLFGERVEDTGAPDAAGAVARARAVADTLKATGWTIASHSYGHIDLSKDSTAVAQRDTARWKALAEPIVGPTDVYIYPFGARPRASTLKMLHDNGFTVFCDIDVGPRLVHADGYTIMSRRHIDGIALEQQARLLAPLFDAGAVEDRAARA